VDIEGVGSSENPYVISAQASGGGGGIVESIVGGDGINVDDTDPANPVVSTNGTTPKVINAQIGTSYTLALDDAEDDAFLTLSNGSPIALEIPLNATVAIPVGAVVEGAQIGAGLVTLTPEGGVTINSIDGLDLAGQYAVFGIMKIATNTWLAYGRLA
jgi:hypothetical protein